MPIPVKDFVKQKVLEFDPTYDVGDGVATTTLLIDPISFVLQPVRDEIDQVKANQSIKTIEELPEPDLFPEDVLDGIASNFIVTRQEGGRAEVAVRIRFFEPQDFSSGVGLVTALGSSGQRFVNKLAINVTAAEMSLNREGTLVFIDASFIAEDVGERFNILAGDIQVLENAPSGVVNATNLTNANGLGRNRETNTELLVRIRTAITVRALVTGRGVISLLTENFGFIEEILPIGFGDPEMMRDIVFNSHIGGHVDVYIKTPAPVQATADFIGLLTDSTRLLSFTTSIVAKDASLTYSVGNASIEPTSVFVAQSFDQPAFGAVFTEGAAYTIDRTNGLFQRITTGVFSDPTSPGHIYHNEVGVGTGSISGSKFLNDSAGSLSFARPGMIITISAGAGAGLYQVKTVVNAFQVEIFGTFPVAALVGVAFQIDEHIAVSYDYHPVAIDVINPPRTGRELMTLTNVPVLYIDSIELLDAITGEPTGVFLERGGGFGMGGFGVGGFGVGEAGDWSYEIGDPHLRFSPREDNVIRFRSGLIGASVRVSYRHASDLQSVQDFVEDSLNRTEAAKFIVKHFIPIFVSTDTALIYAIPAGAVVEDEAFFLAAVTEHIEEILAAGQLEKSDIVDLLYDMGATRVDLDWKLIGQIQHVDGAEEFIAENAKGILSPPSPVLPKETDQPFSPRISHMSALNITLTRVTE